MKDFLKLGDVRLKHYRLDENTWVRRVILCPRITICRGLHFITFTTRIDWYDNYTVLISHKISRFDPDLSFKYTSDRFDIKTSRTMLKFEFHQL